MLLTTQYLDEADQLADRIAVIDRGAQGRRGHARRAQGQRRQLDAAAPARSTRRRPPRRRRSSRACSATSRCSRPRRAASTSPLPDANRAADVLIALREQELLHHVRDRPKPTLDEVFLALTGHGAEDETQKELAR